MGVGASVAKRYMGMGMGVGGGGGGGGGGRGGGGVSGRPLRNVNFKLYLSCFQPFD